MVKTKWPPNSTAKRGNTLGNNQNTPDFIYQEKHLIQNKTVDATDRDRSSPVSSTLFHRTTPKSSPGRTDRCPNQLYGATRNAISIGGSHIENSNKLNISIPMADEANPQAPNLGAWSNSYSSFYATSRNRQRRRPGQTWFQSKINFKMTIGIATLFFILSSISFLFKVSQMFHQNTESNILIHNTRILEPTSIGVDSSTEHKINHATYNVEQKTNHTTQDMETTTLYTYTDPYTSKIVYSEMKIPQRNDIASEGTTNNKSKHLSHPPRQVFYASPSWERNRYIETNQFDNVSISPATHENNNWDDTLQAKEKYHPQPASSTVEITSYHGHVLDPMLQVTPGEESPPQTQLRKPHVEGNCVPMHQWQVDTKLSCNSIHEIDIAWEQNLDIKSLGRNHDGNNTMAEQMVTLLGRGWFRLAWKVEESNIVGSEGNKESFILKTLRFDRDFHDEYYELHRKDAMAMEHLTGSPFVLDIYSFCGQSAANEIAFKDVEYVAKKMRDKKGFSMYKLKMATQLAIGVAHIHECDDPSENATSMIHYDINPRNVAVTDKGMVKINDFNVAEFVKWNTVEQKPCKFKGRLHEPWWRAPEEVNKPKKDEDPPLLDEKVDVYSLCNVLYRIMTGRAPRGKSTQDRMELVREEVSQGLPPPMPSKYLDTQDEAIIAIRQAMVHCYQYKPEDRWSSKQIAEALLNTFEYLSAKEKEQEINN